MPFTYGHIAEDADRAMPLLARALTLEPDYAAAHAWCYHFRFRRGLREEDRIGALRHARAAIAHGVDDPTALGIASFMVAMDEHDHATALTVFDRALALSNSNIFALCCSALVLSFMGRADLADERARLAIRLSPFDNLNYLSYNAMAIAYFCAGRFEEAHDAARCSVQLNPRFYVCHLFLAAALVGLGRLDDAEREAQKVLALDPTFAIGRFAITSASSRRCSRRCPMPGRRQGCQNDVGAGQRVIGSKELSRPKEVMKKSGLPLPRQRVPLRGSRGPARGTCRNLACALCVF